MPTRKDDIVVQSEFKTINIGTSVIQYDAQFFDDPTNEIFTHKYWDAKGAISGHARGRGITWFFKLQNTELVLRHYYRGGAIGKLLYDHYIYFGLLRSRPLREFELLAQLKKLGLPAPYPVAIHVDRISPTRYLGDIITKRIHNTTDLVSLLSERPATENEIITIGQTLRRFHDHNVYHHDLNAHNILLDNQNRAWLIDFDRGAIRPNASSWKNNNLNRLLRSLKKESQRLPQFYWQKSDWDLLLKSYNDSLGRTVNPTETAHT